MTAGADFRSMIPSFVTDARGIATVAAPHVQPTVFPSVPDEDAAMTSKRAQGMVSAAIQQVGQAAKWESEQDGRDGYAQVVALMTTVAVTAETIGKRIQSIVGTGAPYGLISNDDYRVLTTLTATLQTLAEISPAAVWSAAPSTTKST
jgi:hypothetical protein